MMPPVLITERLTLRGLSLDDADTFARFYGSDHSRYYGGPTGPVESWRKLSMYAGSWPLRGYGPWAVTLTDTGETLGMLGPWFPEGWPEPEITYFLLEEHSGKGYAREALRVALDWVFGEAGWTTAISGANPLNTASIALAESCGARPDGQADVPPYGMMDIYRYSPEAA